MWLPRHGASHSSAAQCKEREIGWTVRIASCKLTVPCVSRENVRQPSGGHPTRLRGFRCLAYGWPRGCTRVSAEQALNRLFCLSAVVGCRNHSSLRLLGEPKQADARPPLGSPRRRLVGCDGKGSEAELHVRLRADAPTDLVYGLVGHGNTCQNSRRIANMS